jgi:hypothetical protein
VDTNILKNIEFPQKGREKLKASEGDIGLFLDELVK